jgi:hypothetical protein
MTCQPTLFVQVCHCAASAASINAMAGVLVWAGASAQASRLMPHTRTDLLDQFFDIIRFLDCAHGKHESIVLFEIGFEILRQFHQAGRVLEILLVFRFEDFVALRFAIGQFDIAILGFLVAPRRPRSRGLWQPESSGDCQPQEKRVAP